MSILSTKQKTILIATYWISLFTTLVNVDITLAVFLGAFGIVAGLLVTLIIMVG